MVDQKLVDILACPETKEPLELAQVDLIHKLNQKIQNGELVNRASQKITEKIECGLVRKSDRKVLYPVRQDIPVMLIDEAILLEEV